MLDTYDTHNPNNPVNQVQLERKPIEYVPLNLFDAVNECDDERIDLYFYHIEKRLQLLLNYTNAPQIGRAHV